MAPFVTDVSPRILFILAIVLVFGTVPSPGAVASNLVIDITFQSSAPYYEPPVAVVPMGTPIRWVNATASPHSVQHDECIGEEPCPFQSIAIPPDSSFLLAPLPPGRYAYHCELHPVMRGTLLVTDQSSTHMKQEGDER
ncbi:MAG TPA: cupredoxin domain-containing protein [Nitrospira sp.]|nr:cupredoxin domain-containing protein [Nitrospira sp.]